MSYAVKYVSCICALGFDFYFGLPDGNNNGCSDEAGGTLRPNVCPRNEDDVPGHDGSFCYLCESETVEQLGKNLCISFIGLYSSESWSHDTATEIFEISFMIPPHCHIIFFCLQVLFFTANSEVCLSCFVLCSTQFWSPTCYNFRYVITDYCCYTALGNVPV